MPTGQAAPHQSYFPVSVRGFIDKQTKKLNGHRKQKNPLGMFPQKLQSLGRRKSVRVEICAVYVET